MGVTDVDARQILSAIKRSHADDLVVPECKNGPTTSGVGKMRRLDAWVLLRTWSPLTMVGYEIKVSRSDWRRDEKLDEYMGLCHVLWIAAPKGVVPVDELPDGVGLKELAGCGTGTRLVVKRKATRRSIDLPTQLMAYVLMTRVTLKDDDAVAHGPHDWRKRSLQQWLAEKDDRRQLHYAINEKIRARFEREQAIARAAEEHAATLQHIADRIAELGFDPTQPVSKWKVESELRRLKGMIPTAALQRMQRVAADLTSMADVLEKMRSEGAQV